MIPALGPSRGPSAAPSRPELEREDHVAFELPTDDVDDAQAVDDAGTIDDDVVVEDAEAPPHPPAQVAAWLAPGAQDLELAGGIAATPVTNTPTLTSQALAAQMSGAQTSSTGEPVGMAPPTVAQDAGAQPTATQTTAAPDASEAPARVIERPTGDAPTDTPDDVETSTNTTSSARQVQGSQSAGDAAGLSKVAGQVLAGADVSTQLAAQIAATRARMSGLREALEADSDGADAMFGLGGAEAAARIGRAQGVAPVTATRSIQEQIADVLQSFAQNEGGEARITLEGGPLGRLSALVRMDGQDLVVQLLALDPAQREALEASLGDLREALADAELVLGDVDVSADTSSDTTERDDASLDRVGGDLRRGRTHRGPARLPRAQANADPSQRLNLLV